MKKLFFIFIVLLFTASCSFQYETKPEMVEQIRKGMTSKEVFDIMPGDSTEWSECDNGAYKYGWNFQPPASGHMKKTFWVIIKEGKVINIYTI